MTNPTPSASGPKKSPRRELLEEAADLIDGDRNVSYGSPTQNFMNIAELWNIRFAHMLKDDEKFTAADVADSMILVKVARNIANQKRDNWADIAGYAGCGYEATLGEDETPPEPKKPDFTSGIEPNDTPLRPWQLFTDAVKPPAAQAPKSTNMNVMLDMLNNKAIQERLAAEVAREIKKYYGDRGRGSR